MCPLSSGKVPTPSTVITLERQGADIQRKGRRIRTVESLRNHHKLKDDAISQFSDQLCVINNLQEKETSASMTYIFLTLNGYQFE